MDKSFKTPPNTSTLIVDMEINTNHFNVSTGRSSMTETSNSDTLHVYTDFLRTDDGEEATSVPESSDPTPTPTLTTNLLTQTNKYKRDLPPRDAGRRGDGRGALHLHLPYPQLVPDRQ